VKFKILQVMDEMCSLVNIIFAHLLR